MKKWGWRIQFCWWLVYPTWIEDPRYAIEKIKEYLKLEENPQNYRKIALEKEKKLFKK